MTKIDTSHNSHRRVLNGALILASAALISKILSAVYRVPFQNLVGNIGYYIYQQVYPFYGILMTLSLTGLPIFISKIMAEQERKSTRKNLYWQIFVTLTVLALIILIIFQTFAKTLGYAMGDVKLVSLIRVVSLLLILMPFLATTRGYFQGDLEMRPTAISQILEQLFRVSFIVIVALLAHYHHWNLYRMGTDTMLAAFFAGILAIIVLSYYLKFNPIKFNFQPVLKYRVLLKRLLNEGGILCVLSSLMVLMQLVDSFTVKPNLVIYGFSNFDAQNIKGIYDRSQPLVQLGLVIGTGFATSFIPSLVKKYRNHDLNEFKKTARLMVQISMTITFGIAMGIISLIHSINMVLFKTPSEDLTIAVYCLSIIVATILVIHNSVLQSLNHSYITWLAVLLGIFMKILLVGPLIRRLGIIGGSLSTLLALMLIWLINYLFASEFIKKSLYQKLFLIKITLITLFSGILIMYLQFWLQTYMVLSRISALIIILILIPIGGLIFLSLCLLFRLFDFKLVTRKMLQLFKSKI